MLTDEQVIRIRRNNDYLLKLIDLVRLTCKEDYAFIIFRNLNKIESMEEKILYLLFIFINNCDENYLEILIDTEIVFNDTVNNFLNNGIIINEINSDIVKNYLNANTQVDVVDSINNINDNLKKKDNKKNNDTCVDYNLKHLEKESFKDIELRNMKMKRKIRRKILYEKYQGGF